MANTMEKWLGYSFSSGSYTGDDYKKFQRAARANLKKQCAEYGFELHQFSGNHYEFSAVLQNMENQKFIYVCISDVRYWQDEWYHRVLIRTMMHEKDWTGGANHFCEWNRIGETAKWLSRSLCRAV